jgi:hypothetical protein
MHACTRRELFGMTLPSRPRAIRQLRSFLLATRWMRMCFPRHDRREKPHIGSLSPPSDVSSAPTAGACERVVARRHGRLVGDLRWCSGSEIWPGTLRVSTGSASQSPPDRRNRLPSVLRVSRSALVSVSVRSPYGDRNHAFLRTLLLLAKGPMTGELMIGAWARERG